MAKKVLLIILDGWGLGPKYQGNAIALASTPFYDQLTADGLTAKLAAAGEAVGLPEGQMGTSEVNHLTIGAGRVLFQDLVKINKAIDDQSFFANPAFKEAFTQVKKNHSTLHVQGLVSPGGVHAHQDHIFMLLKAAKDFGVTRIFVHVFTDGRDTLPKSALAYVSELQAYMRELGVGKIASIAGRYYAMDRDHNWERTDKAFEVLQGKKSSCPIYHSAEEAIEACYAKGQTDEFIEPALIEIDDSGEVGAISTHDAVIFANFRNDRTRQLTERILSVKDEHDLAMVTMTQYKPDYQVLVAFKPEKLTDTLGEVLARENKKQLRLTETEKFAHLTFFFNAKREAAFEGEDRMMIDSYSDIKTHDQRPEMRTPEIARRLKTELREGYYDFIATNLCNADMVGHTSNIPATIKGIETIDHALSEIIPLATASGYQVIITADHGNAEEMFDQRTLEPLTAHTLNPVPFILVPAAENQALKLTHTEGSLADVAPTILDLMGLPTPAIMTGKTFIAKSD
jgi:2,3-bisphosphoglycerate-independent phosphoglycerate mutase